VWLSLGKVVPALLAGNPVVLKPAPNTPLTVTAIVAALAERLPPGVLGVVHGGAEVGTRLVGHADIRKVVFTGSTANGARVYAAATIKNVTLELGGNKAAIVLDDVELTEPLLRTMLASTFVTSGQVCWAIKRVYVPRSRASEFIESFSQIVDTLVLGHGLDPAATIGPVNNGGQLGIVRDLVESARAGGATIRTLGRRTGDTDAGHFHPPTIVSDVSDSCPLVWSEQFGPALPIVGYDGVDNAVRAANGTPYGLCASVRGSDEQRAFEVARRLRGRAGVRQRPRRRGAGLHPRFRWDRSERRGPGDGRRRRAGLHRAPVGLEPCP
jgi:aldehyde dehydrogenase